MLRICESFDECSFYFLASLIKNLIVKEVVGSYYLKLSLPMFLNFCQFQPQISYRHVSCKKYVYDSFQSDTAHIHLSTTSGTTTLLVDENYNWTN